MGINFKTSNVKLNSVKTYNVNNNPSNIFKGQFYGDVEDIDYSKYDNVSHNVFDLEKGIEKAKNEVKKEKKSFWKTIKDVIVSTRATEIVGITSLLSGVADVVESVVIDGGGGLIATIGDWCGCDTTHIKEFVARDLVTEFNDSLYGKGGILSGINDASYLKYDSKVAQGVRNVTKDVTKMVAATALSAVPVAGPFLVAGVGFLDGYGEAAENIWKNGTDTTGWEYAAMFGSGALGSLSWYAEGKFGREVYTIGKEATKSGIKVVGKQFFNTIFNKEFIIENLKKALLSKGAIGNYISAGFMTADDIIPYITGAKEFSVKDLAYLFGEYTINLGKNVVEDLFREGVNDYYNKYTQGMPSYSDLGKLCKEQRITVEEYVTLSRTPQNELSDNQKRTIFEIRNKLTAGITNSDGTLKDGTRVSKAISEADFQRFYSDGSSATVGSCIGLADDTDALKTGEQIVDSFGLRYKDNPFENSDGTLNDFYVIEGNFHASNGSKVVTRVTPTTDYVNPDSKEIYDSIYDAYGQQILSAEDMANQTYYDNIKSQLERTSQLSGIPKENMYIEDPKYYNVPNNPYTGTGITLNQGNSSKLGGVEFYGMDGRSDIKDGAIYKISGDKKILVAIIDSKGIVHRQ